MSAPNFLRLAKAESLVDKLQQTLTFWCKPLPRRFVLAVLFFALGDAFSIFDTSQLLILFCAALLLVLALLCRQMRLYLVLLLLVLGGYLQAFLRLPTPTRDDLSHMAGSRHLLICGEILELKNHTRGRQILLKAQKAILNNGAEIKNLSGFCLVNIDERKKKVPLSINDKVQLPICLRLTKPALLQKRGIFSEAKASASAITILPNKSGCSLNLSPLRSAIIQGHRNALGNDNGDLLSSMVLGDRAVELNPAILNTFRTVGLSHILAASGFNLSVVIAVLYFFARLVSRKVFFINMSCFSGMIFFVLLAGVSPSVLRAAITCSLLLLSRCTYRTLYLPAALATALLISVVLDPLSLADVGFQLSYLATAGMIAGMPVAGSFLSDENRYLIRCLVNLFFPVIIAQLAVLPIQMYYFGRLGLFFLIANMLVAPAVPTISILGFVSSAFLGWGQLFPLSAKIAAGIDTVVFYPLELMKVIAAYLATLPGASFAVNRPELGCILLYYFALLSFFLLFSLQRWRVGCGFCLGTALLFLFVGK